MMKSICTIAFAIALFVLSSCTSPQATNETTADQPEPSQSAKQDAALSEMPVRECIAVYEKLFGENGCMAGMFSEGEIKAACEGYGAWADHDNPCGAQALSGFYLCLGSVECRVFNGEQDEEDEDEYDRSEYISHFYDCRKEFASDMNVCLKQE